LKVLSLNCVVAKMPEMSDQLQVTEAHEDRTKGVEVGADPPDPGDIGWDMRACEIPSATPDVTELILLQDESGAHANRKDQLQVY